MGKPVIITEKEFDETRLKLINAASVGKTVFYETIAVEKDNLQHGHLIKVIEAISLFEYIVMDRPLLCAIVVGNITNKELDANKPGGSFDKFCFKYDIQEDLVTLQKECFEKWGDEKFRSENIETDRIIEEEVRFKQFLKDIGINS